MYNKGEMQQHSRYRLNFNMLMQHNFKHQHQQETLTLLTAANRLTTVKSMNKCESEGECVLTSSVTEVRRNSSISSSVPYCCAHATCQSTVRLLLYVAHITDIKSL